MSKTKKEIIIENARRDPFLKIDNIAERAATTPRYVKTILSQANVSLMKLRKKNARSMENRKMNIKDRLLMTYAYNVPFGNNSHIERHEDLIFNNPEDFNRLNRKINDNYLNYSYLHKLNRDNWSIDTIMLASKFFDFDDSNLTIHDIIEGVSSYLKGKYFSISDINLKIELAAKQLSDLFNIPLLAPLFRVEQTIEYKSEVIILMLSYFNPARINLSLSIKKGLVIDRKSITK